MLLISIIYYIFSSAITTRRDINVFYNRFMLVNISYSILLSTFAIMLINNDIGLYNNLFKVNCVNSTFNIFILLLSFLIININSFYPIKYKFKENILLSYIPKIVTKLNEINRSGEQYRISEYPLIILFIILGAVFFTCSNDIVSLFLSIELQSYGLYILCTLYRNSELSTSAGLTYFLLGGLSSCFILLGTSLLYANSGVTNLDNYYIINSLFDIKYNTFLSTESNYINYSLLIMSIGFLFKISAAPFHFWSPDVYDAIPTITTAFVAIVTKISLLIFILELVNFTSSYRIANINWTIILLFSSLLSLIIGTVLGLNQSRIKRLFAYSTISHMGFLLLGLSVNSIESIQAFVFYLTQYSLSNLTGFILLISIGYIFYNYTSISFELNRFVDKNNSPIQLISQLKGLYTLNPMISISFAITMYSLIGIPPLIGFFGKQTILSSSLDQGHIFISLIAILTSVISAVYYLNILKQIFFNESDFNKAYYIKILEQYVKPNYYNIYLSNNLTLSISVLTLIMLLFILNPKEWLNLSNYLSFLIFS